MSTIKQHIIIPMCASTRFIGGIIIIQFRSFGMSTGRYTVRWYRIAISNICYTWSDRLVWLFDSRWWRCTIRGGLLLTWSPLVLVSAITNWWPVTRVKNCPKMLGSSGTLNAKCNALVIKLYQEKPGNMIWKIQLIMWTLTRQMLIISDKEKWVGGDLPPTLSL